MALEDMTIPVEIRREAADIIARIEHATGMLDASMVGGVAEGFLIALRCVNAITAKDIDQLERVFADATDEKMVSLRKSN